MFQAEASDRGSAAVLSAPVAHPITVSAAVVGVNDLTVEQRGEDDDPAFELSWQPPPAGRVVIYRTQHGPAAGADGQLVDVSALATMGLAADAQLTYPV